MKICDCGGKLYRRSRDLIKATGETKIRLRCNLCSRWESHYVSPVGERRIEQRPGGRPAIDD